MSFFRAMVVMGSGLAAGCGGIARENPPDGSGGVSGSGAESGVSGSSAGSGGTPRLVVGGASPGQGGAKSPIGLSPEPPSVEPGPFECPSQQLDCWAPNAECSGEGVLMPSSCACNPSLPASESDCKEGEVFVCRGGAGNVRGRFEKTVPFACSCVPVVPEQYACEYCIDPGDPHGDVFQYRCVGTPNEDPTSVLCGCALVLLR